MEIQKIAAIDIGSNSIKLVVAEIEGKSIRLVQQKRRRVCLGKTLGKRILSTEAILQTARAVGKLRARAERMGAETIIAVATASVREAENSCEFVRKIENLTGIRVRILSTEEEARLIGIAATHYFHRETGRLLNIDIGGGSTELSLMKNARPVKLFSMPIGAVRLTEKFLRRADPPRAEDLELMRAEVLAVLRHPRQELSGEKWEISTGTSGTIFKFSQLLNSANGEIEFERLVSFNKKLAAMTFAERAALPGISPQRAERLVAGGQILETVMRELKIQALRPCAYALREGLLIDFLQNKQIENQSPARWF